MAQAAGSRTDAPGRRAKPARKRDAAATREAILAAARQAFTELGYDGAGVREISALAGVNVALVSRYFGSKEGLFEEAVPATFSVAPLLTEERAGFAEGLARYVLTKEKGGADGFDPTLALLRSAGNAQAAELMRAGLETRFVKPLARWLGGEGAELRAGLVVALLAGAVVMRDVLRIAPLQRDREKTVRLLAELLAVLVEPAAPARPDPAPSATQPRKTRRSPAGAAAVAGPSKRR